MLRIATYNTSLFSPEPGGLIRQLERGSWRARRVAAVLQCVRPDIVLLNEFDHDADGRAAKLFQHRYLERSQAGGTRPLHYRHRHLAAVNTGEPSGLDLDGDGHDDGPGDAWEFGSHPGQYGMLLLSRYPLDTAAVRSFRQLKWSAMPGALRPSDPDSGLPFHPAPIWQAMRLSSKSHWDVPVRTPHGVLHILASHPTPPAFDGPEQRNVLRNHDELRLWREYLDADSAGGDADWLADDQGRVGGLPHDARFALLGDLNNDPISGTGRHGIINALLEHPRIRRHPPPTSDGGPACVATYAEAGIDYLGDPAAVTGDFGPVTGALRLDYVLPSKHFDVVDSGVHWPHPDDEPGARIASGSDHHLVWADLVPA